MTELSAFVRFTHLAAAVLLVGSYGFILLIARPAAKSAGSAANRIAVSHSSFHRRVTRASLVTLFVSALCALWLQIINVTDPTASASINFRGVAPLLTETLYGKVWLARIALIGFLSFFLISRGNRTKEESIPALVGGCILSAALLTSISLSGHAAAAEGLNLAVQIFLDGSHLLASGFWLGGLVPLFVFLRNCNATNDANALIITREATQRYSRLGLICVTMLIVTGAYNAWILVGSLPALFGTPYGRLLLIKLALLLPLLGIAAINLKHLKPSIVAAPTDQPERIATLAKKLRRNVIIEACFGIMILFIVGSMGVTPPARHVQPDWPFSFRWDWSSLAKLPKARTEVERGVVWAAVGGIAVLTAFARRRRRIVSAAIGVGALGYAGYIIHAAVLIDAYPATYKRPAVTYHAISVANGKALYQDSGCVTCHGAKGYGDGPTAEELNPKPADLTAPHANAHTAGDLFWWLSHGVKPSSAMPGYNESLSEEERWDLINFMRALSSGERARNLAPVIDSEPWLVAPDFAYGTNAGDTKMLRDHRGEKIVLLMLLNVQSTAKRLKQLAAALSQLRSAGVEILVVPNVIDYLYVADKLPGLIVNEGIREITETYSLFSRSFAEEKAFDMTPHMEFLIDKQGYIRARWLPAENDAWGKIDVLLKQVDLLRNEKTRAPAPDEHVH
jgi:putative copper export protein/mono/diheme cytochrome c family protein/peroxiredoxin